MALIVSARMRFWTAGCGPIGSRELDTSRIADDEAMTGTPFPDATAAWDKRFENAGHIFGM
jgi:hypothetical protein